MKKFLVNTGLFIAIILILATIADILVSKGLQNTPKNHLETMNMVMHDSPKYDVLVLGNSRGACGYDTYILDSLIGCNSYNLSNSGKGFTISNLRYQAYRRNNPAPKLIIVNIDHLEMGTGTLGFENYMFYPYITDSLVKPVLKMNHFSWLDCHIPMYRYRGDYKYISLGLCELFNIYHLHGKGYKGYTPSPNNSWNGMTMRTIIKSNPHQLLVALDSTIVGLADTFMAQAKKEGIQVVMVYSPVYCEIQENLSPKYDTLMCVYENLSKKYDVPILDYRHTAINQDSTCFKDGNHLCKLGAELFTTQLAKDIDYLQLYSSPNLNN
ncbi:MAG: hypothetical protein MJZ92_03475 [Paludibacteraceae bacterium]|nr:hypothetical protein [Paludibacteraceae bacterium]